MLTIQANRQLRNAAEFGEVIIASRGGLAVRLRDVARSKTALKRHALRQSQWRTFHHPLAIYRQPGANTVRVVDAAKEVLPRLKCSCPSP